MSSTTDSHTADELASALETRLTRACGDDLRAVVRYDEDSIEIQRMNDGAKDGIPPEKKLPVLKQTTGYRPVGGPYGEHSATIYSYEDVLVLHAPVTGDSGVVATLDPDSTRNVSLAELLPDR
ncbi:hypothetical protein [Natranaeroarchaeum sulfidigenes]|uniref:Uncharacterized protein n=1 Tax=Natranaeroarchaeum sulfidigenes TaxID=2784880 RepID=A0A897MVG1_9EURY|nr:hypothetical protein [Natranaeroarchaeum sulfidigenes]QSG03998.1 Uncharacterized protein AArcS_2806 [Natranaeroarchaeum sulfidigenes]